jgi:hypothetical protein
MIPLFSLKICLKGGRHFFAIQECKEVEANTVESQSAGTTLLRSALSFLGFTGTKVTAGQAWKNSESPAIRDRDALGIRRLTLHPVLDNSERLPDLFPQVAVCTHFTNHCDSVIRNAEQSWGQPSSPAAPAASKRAALCLLTEAR